MTPDTRQTKFPVHGFYMLIGQTAVPVDDLMTWAEWFEHADRIVLRDELPGGVLVSTVFLGLDHGFTDGGAPILFETMVFHDGEGVEMERCSTWLEAEDQHRRVVTRAKQGAL